KFLLDRVILAHDMVFLKILVSGIVLAAFVQGSTSYLLAQLLSKDAQRLIAQMRRKVQAHISRLPVSYYDSSQCGALASRIMNDVEGMRNFVDTGLLELSSEVLASV